MHMVSTIGRKTDGMLAVRAQNNAPDEISWEKLAADAQYRPGQLAALCNVSLRTLQRHYRSHYHVSVGEWLRRLKADTAYQRLRAGDAIKVVAYDLGFKQLSHFSRFFKSAHGVAPRFVAVERKTPLTQLLAKELPRLEMVPLRRVECFNFENIPVQPASICLETNFSWQ